MRAPGERNLKGQRAHFVLTAAHDVASQTPEDILGFGYVFSWVAIAFVQAFLVAIAVLLVPRRIEEPIAN